MNSEDRKRRIGASARCECGRYVSIFKPEAHHLIDYLEEMNEIWGWVQNLTDLHDHKRIEEEIEALRKFEKRFSSLREYFESFEKNRKTEKVKRGFWARLFRGDIPL